MPSSNYPHGFANGLTVRGLPINLAHPGKVFFLNNSAVVADGGIGGSDSNIGSYQKPFSTLSGAISNCTASRGDIIMVMPGHTETISSATALTLSVAGVAIVGLGVGTMRPTFTLDTANTATINVTAANISISNCLFVANFLAIAALFTTTTAKGFSLNNCEFRDTTSVLNFKVIVDTNTTSNDTDGLSIIECQMNGLGTTSGSCLVKMDGTNRGLTIKDNIVKHAATSTAGLMPIAAGKVVTDVDISRNVISLVGAQAATTGIIITTDGSTNAGIIRYNLINSLDDTSEILVTASSGFMFMENKYSSSVALSGYTLPAADA